CAVLPNWDRNYW
nr:immunoglobulin heavy chain junction region [Mus musculus]